MECRDLDRYIDAYLDGEFDSLECREVEGHLEACEPCRLAAANMGRLKRTVRERALAVTAPPALLDRVRGSLDETAPSGPASPEDQALFGDALPAAAGAGRRGWRSVPLFASAAFLLLFVWVAGGGFSPSAPEEELLEDTVAKHSRALPLEVSVEDLARIRGWARGKVDFNPRLPHFHPRLRPVGARLSHVLDHPAVYLAYDGPQGGRASLFVFTARDDLMGSASAPRRRVGDREVVLASRRGYNVVLWQDREIVYSLVSDLDEEELLELVGTVDGTSP